jgi:hypothetical protein
MKTLLLSVLCTLFLAAYAGPKDPNKNNNGNHYGWDKQLPDPAGDPDAEEDPGEMPGDPDDPTNVPFDDGVPFLIAGVVVWAAYKSWKRRYQQPREINL